MPSGEEDDDLTVRCLALLAKGEAQRARGEPDHRATLLEAGRLARQVGEPALLARAAKSVARGFLTATEPDPDRIALVEAAVAAHRADSPTRARLLASLAGERILAGERTAAAVLIEEAVAVAHRTGDGETLLMTMATRWDVLFHPSTLAERRRLAIELEERATAADSDHYRWRAASLGAMVSLEAGDDAAAEAHLDRAVERADTLDQPLPRFITTLQQATWAIARGRLEAAEQLATTAHELGLRARSDQATNAFTAQLVQIRIFQGRLDETLPQMGSAALELPAGRAAYAVLCAETGHAVEASNAFKSVVSHSREPIPRDVTWAYGVAALAEMCCHLGDARRAAELEAALAPYRRQHLAHATYYIGPVAHTLGLLRAAQGDLEGADQLLVEAEAMLVSFGAPAHLARTRLIRCRILTRSSRRGDRSMTSAVARHAASEARAAGFDALADQIEAHI